MSDRVRDTSSASISASRLSFSLSSCRSCSASRSIDCRSLAIAWYYNAWPWSPVGSRASPRFCRKQTQAESRGTCCSAATAALLSFSSASCQRSCRCSVSTSASRDSSADSREASSSLRVRHFSSSVTRSLSISCHREVMKWVEVWEIAAMTKQEGRSAASHRLQSRRSGIASLHRVHRPLQLLCLLCKLIFQLLHS